jgi:regulator of RNase E activity RraA
VNADDTAALCERLRKLGAAVTSDVLGEMGLRSQVLSAGIRALGNDIVAGPALCVRGERSDQAHRIAFDMDRRLTPGAIAVLATGDYQDSAVIGGNIALSFTLRGAQAVVTDGGTRWSSRRPGCRSFAASARRSPRKDAGATPRSTNRWRCPVRPATR